MLFTPLILLLPAVSHASWLPFRRGQPSNPEDCTVTSTLFPITVTSIHPTSTIGPHGSGSGSGSGYGGSNGSGGSGHSQVTGGGSLIYTTTLPTLGPNGPGAHTYTITAPCASSDCQRPAPTECPPGFTTTAVICHVCGELPVTTTLTLPIESATAAQGSHGGAAKAGSTLTAVVTAVIHKTVVPVSPAESAYPWISRGGPEMPDAQKPSQVPGGSDSKHDEAGKGDEIPDGPKNTGAPESPAGADTTATVDAPNGLSTAAGNQAGHGDGDEAGSESASPSDDASPSAVVVTSHAPETKVTRSVVIKAALFAAMVLYPLYV